MSAATAMTPSRRRLKDKKFPRTMKKRAMDEIPELHRRRNQKRWKKMSKGKEKEVLEFKLESVPSTRLPVPRSGFFSGY